MVQRYVKRWRETNRESSAAFLDLSWAPGVMQVEFGVAQATVAERETETHCLVVWFPWSTMRY